MTATYFAIASERQLSADQVPFISEQEERAALRGDIDARTVLLFSDAVRAPKLFAGRRFEADELA